MVTGRESYGGEDAFKIWVCQRSLDGRHMGLRGAVIKQGRDVMKTVDAGKLTATRQTGEVRKRELRFRTHERRKTVRLGGTSTSPDPKTTWYCENEEIERLLSFLHSDVSRTGRFRVVDTESPSGVVLSLLRSGDLDSQAFAEALDSTWGYRKNSPALLAASNAGLSAAQSAVVARETRP